MKTTNARERHVESPGRAPGRPAASSLLMERGWWSEHPELATELGKLTPNLSRPFDFVVHVAGVAGAGKSSLLNALLADHETPLPAGGVGSKTAEVTHIRHDEMPRVRAWYDLSRLEAIAAALAQASPDPSRVQEARMLVTGSQYDPVENTYLREVLAAVTRGRPFTAQGADHARAIDDLRELVKQRSGCRDFAGSSAREVRVLLERQVAGHHAPLIARAEVGWPAAFMERGLELLDVPGLGVVSDPFARHARKALMSARALLLVVDRSGITDEVYLALDRFLRDLSSGPVDPSRLMVCVTRLDQVMRSERVAGAERAVWLAQQRPLVEQVVRDQLVRGASAAHWPRTDVWSRVPVVPVLPVEHAKLMAAEPDDRSFLLQRAESGIDELRSLLTKAASRHRREVLGHLERLLPSRAPLTSLTGRSEKGS